MFLRSNFVYLPLSFDFSRPFCPFSSLLVLVDMLCAYAWTFRSGPGWANKVGFSNAPRLVCLSICAMTSPPPQNGAHLLSWPAYASGTVHVFGQLLSRLMWAFACPTVRKRHKLYIGCRLLLLGPVHHQFLYLLMSLLLDSLALLESNPVTVTMLLGLQQLSSISNVGDDSITSQKWHLGVTNGTQTANATLSSSTGGVSFNQTTSSKSGGSKGGSKKSLLVAAFVAACVGAGSIV